MMELKAKGHKKFGSSKNIREYRDFHEVRKIVDASATNKPIKDYELSG